MGLRASKRPAWCAAATVYVRSFWDCWLCIPVAGDVVRYCAEDAGVDIKHVVTDESDGADVGLFTVLPDQQRVWYQVKRRSALCANYRNDAN